MKKILAHLTGIVFLITILATGGCKQGTNPEGSTTAENGSKDLKKVTITLKAIKKNRKKHLQMYDSNDPNNVVDDDLVTIVMPGDTVVWEIITGWRLKKLERIGPKEIDGTIIIKDAEPIPDTKSFMLIIPDSATPGRESYDIKCKRWIGMPWEIDPYLEIPPPD